MNAFRNLAGQKFGYLTVIERVPPAKGKTTSWVCRCDCGSEKVCLVQMGSLVAGLTVSCGCHRKRLTKSINTKHGFRGAKPERTYVSWQSMKDRCTNPNLPKWKNHGGRGVTFCARWEKFECFLEDMGIRPEGMSLDRINNDGNYEPSNCKWSTPSEQARNRRTRMRSSK